MIEVKEFTSINRWQAILVKKRYNLMHVVFPIRKSWHIPHQYDLVVASYFFPYKRVHCRVLISLRAVPTILVVHLSYR